MASPFPFSSGDVLTAADLNAIGEWTAFTPSWTNLTVGNGTQSFFYAETNEVLAIQGVLTFGSTTAITSTVVRLQHPLGGTFPTYSTGQLQLREDGVGTRNGLVSYSGGELILQYYAVSGSVVNSANVGTSSPHTWGTNDYIRLVVMVNNA